MTKATTATTTGIRAHLVQVTAARTRPPGLEISGMPDLAAAEMSWRIKGALRAADAEDAASGMRLELQPASAFGHHLWDLAAALAALAEAGRTKQPGDTVIIGSLHQDGKTGLVTSTTPIATLARDEGRPLMLPAENLREAGIVNHDTVVPVADIGEAVEWLNGERDTVCARPGPTRPDMLDMADIEGHEEEKRALLVAAAGRHNVLLAGAPCVGAVALTRRLPGLLGPMDERERLEAAAIYSIAGMLDPERNFGWERPLCAPHHTASPVAIAGSTEGAGGRSRPGDASLAHAGVLLLDEIDEFRRHTIDSVREALATEAMPRGTDAGAAFPARFMLAATAVAHPPPGSYRFDSAEEHDKAVAAAVRRVPTPELFDIAVDVRRHQGEPTLAGAARSGETAPMAADVQRARRRAAARRERGLRRRTAAMRDGSRVDARSRAPKRRRGRGRTRPQNRMDGQRPVQPAAHQRAVARRREPGPAAARAAERNRRKAPAGPPVVKYAAAAAPPRAW